jgi:hypothetical protein
MISVILDWENISLGGYCMTNIKILIWIYYLMMKTHLIIFMEKRSTSGDDESARGRCVPYFSIMALELMVQYAH